jgi:outer membrane lipoprotein-sorting protein
MKKLIALFSVFMLITAVNAQDPDVFKAKEILDKVAAKTKNYSTIRADFSITLENLQAKVSDTYAGKITFKGNKYKVELMNTEIYCDGETMWTYLPDANEVSISDASIMEDSMLDPTTIFTIYEKEFKYIYAGETTINGKKVDIVDLLPITTSGLTKDKNKKDPQYSRIKVFVYKDNLQFARLAQIGKDGNNYIIEIKKMEINVPADDAIFKKKKKKYQGIVVTDMR